MLLRLFAQLSMSFPVILCLVLNSISHLILLYKWHFNPPAPHQVGEGYLRELSGQLIDV